MNVSPFGSIPWASWPEGAVVVVVTYSLREAIVARCLASATLTALVGTRVRPLKRPQSELDVPGQPTVTYLIKSNVLGHWLTGGNGVAEARVRFDCWSRNLSECVLLKRALENAWHGYMGTVLGVVILWARQDGEADDGDAADDGTDDVMRRIPVDYYIKYRCPIPTFN